MLHFGIMHLRRDGTIIADSDGHKLAIGRVWLARFGDTWRERYGTTWAFGYGRDTVWFYTPKPKR